MVWRIHFTEADLARTRIMTTLGPLAETMWAVWFLRCPLQPPQLFSNWRARAGTQLSASMNPLTTLIPPGSLGVDLCTLTGETETIEQGVEALLAIPRDHLLAELETFDRRRKLPASAWAISDPGSDARQQLAVAARATYRALVESYWPRLHARLRAEQVPRDRAMARGGADELLTTLQRAGLRWQPPVLTVRSVGADVDTYLDGRGLVLIPSVFVGWMPAFYRDLRDRDAAPWLIFPTATDYPVSRGPWTEGRPGTDRALGALIGRTRAAALSGLDDGYGCTTTELARRLGVSIGAASQHATVLREAGLLTTLREGCAVVHLLTPLGAELLDAGHVGHIDQTQALNPSRRRRR